VDRTLRVENPSLVEVLSIDRENSALTSPSEALTDARKNRQVWAERSMTAPMTYRGALQKPLGIKIHMGGEPMSWSAPKIKEINCGMEINMYAPSEDERRGHEPDLF
jgi:coenzyme PQQ precursor peptide PqqA